MGNKKDRMLIGAVVLAAVVLLAVFYLHKPDGTEVVITIGGEVYGTYPLEKNEIIRLDTGDGTNIVKIEDGTVSMSEASCPDQICVNSYPLSKGQPGLIVCLPHKVVVEIKENNY